ncbi:sorbitol dehydrogenase [Quercus suber]|uniref:Sorbitol dehydrogenase n=1 Tax=Quercus suber TaxID=58331 RepID=A0AAW0JV28_QUESU
MGKGGMSHGSAGEAKDGEEENMAAWLLGTNTLKIQPFKLPPLAVGICGNDVHFLKTLRCADFVVKEPMVIGHECAGIIEEVGSEVKKLVPGDRVALEPGNSCWRCNLCKEGRYNLCPEMKFLGAPPVHGSLANKIDVKPLITHRFGFSQKEVEEAFETSAGGGNAIKLRLHR